MTSDPGVRSEPDDPAAIIAGLRQGIAELMSAEPAPDPLAPDPLVPDQLVPDQLVPGAGPQPDVGPNEGAVGGHRSRRRRDGAAAGHDLEDDPVAAARSIVLRRLTDRPRTRHELAQFLRRKGIPDDAAEQVLDRMEQVRLVDDAGYARAYVESTQERRHLSRQRLRQDLRRRGVSADDVEAAVSDVDDDDEYAAAHDLAARRLRPIAHLDAGVQRRRIGQALQRRGFAPALIRRVLDEVTSDHEPITKITTR